MNIEIDRNWITVAHIDDVPDGGVIPIVVEGKEIALFNLGGSIHATCNVCTHGRALLSEGFVTEDGQVECPLHAGCFDIRTGKGMGLPIEEDLQTFDVKVEDGTIFVALAQPIAGDALN